ncbi:unnamed protein product, partial [Mesorhabditis belari]|uniref:Uncharacterized protein n=1 Tax=Mesorhabditis belari TaxID=2138241 RepID=A0AAF3EVW8_9BILA
MLGMKLFLPEGTDEEITRKIRKLGAENAVMERIFQVHGVPDDQYQSIYHRPVSKRPMLGKLQEIFVLLSTRLGNDVGPLKGSDLFNLITRMLDPNPKNRLRADECLSHPFLLKMNEKYEERLEKQEQMKKNGLVQPKDDNGMRQRNEKDKEVLLKELAQPQNRRIFIDELMQADEMKDDEMKEGKDQEMIEEFSQIAT